jgi:signal transduction histidine kinase
VLDGDGVILAVNKAWDTFQGRTPAGLGAIPVGTNYLSLLEHVAATGNSYARTAVEWIRDVIEGRRSSASLDYAYSDRDPRWYLARVVRLDGSQRSVVISHQDITDRMMSHLALENAHKRLKVLSKRVLEVQEEERRVIAGELHDDVGQTLTALKIALHRAAHGTGTPSVPELHDCIGMAEHALEKIRTLALDIRPPQLDELGLVDALGALVERQRLATGLQIRWHVRGTDDTRAPASLETACYRIAQEAISNASRHANAGVIEVALECDDALLKLCIHDDGKGFDTETARQAVVRTGHLGLIGMEERAQLAGGRLKVRSVLGGGTTVSAVFPLARIEPGRP